jgi:dinuclear metal center YbgI/SA1388 family protein
MFSNSSHFHKMRVAVLAVCYRRTLSLTLISFIMVISDIVTFLESFAPSSYQESYDNAGLLTGSSLWTCNGVLVTLDCTEEVITEARERGCNLVVAHHPIIFSGLKRLNGSSYTEKAVIAAIKNDIAIYAIHTNLDNVESGVNARIADQLGLVNRSVLEPKKNTLRKLYTFVPRDAAEKLRMALFEAGAGMIGKYSECSFNTAGEGTFKAAEGANPYVGDIGSRHSENEIKVEVVFPAPAQDKLVKAMRKAHPYEEVAFDIIDLVNDHPGIGSGLVGELAEPTGENALLKRIQSAFGVACIRHTRLLGKQVKTVAVCGGAGSFLRASALRRGVDFFITADMKYHEFFDAEDRMVIADIGHWESEQFTTDLLLDILRQKFPTFALLKSKTDTNPVKYFKS